MRYHLLTFAAAIAATGIGSASAQAPVLPGVPEVRQGTPGGQVEVKPAEVAATGIWDRANLFGDLGGVRTRLGDLGVSFGLQETSEVLGNLSGGTRQMAVYEGLTQMSVGVDLEKAIGLTGGVFNVSGWQIHGRGLSVNALDNNLHTVSGIEAPRGTLLFELWYEQQLFDKKLAIRIGQIAADQEFMVSQYGYLFDNHTFGWATLPSTDLPSSGPSFPLAAPGVRVRVLPSPEFALLAAVTNGDPAGPGPGTPQQRDPNGTAFRLRDGVFAIGEVQYALNAGEDATGLPGTYKLGAWYNSNTFADQRRTRLGDSLAAFGSNVGALPGQPKLRRGNWSAYAVADQLVWRRGDTKDQGVGVFMRLMGAPGDRNLINFYAEGGVTFKGAFAARPADTAGFAVGYARISDTASKLDSDIRAQDGTTPIRRHETVVELTYQAQFAPWLQLQPYAEYVFNLNGGVNNPLQPGKRLGDAAVLALRTTITF